jgi:hypothetical protein
LSETAQFAATVYDKKDRAIPEAVVTWSVSDPSVASIDQTGTATSQSNGSVSIIATSDGVTGTAVLTVDQEAASVQVSPSVDTLTVLQTTSQFTASAFDAQSMAIQGRTFTWVSSDETVATVDANGLATGIGVGSAQISATMDGITESATLTVTRTASVEVGPDGGTLRDVDGLVSLDIPAGALAQATTLQIELGAVPLPTGFGALGEAVTLYPEGQQFDVPVTLTIPVPGGIDPLNPVQVYQYSPDDDLLIHQETMVFGGAGTVTVELTHFSTYLLAPVLIGIDAPSDVGYRLRNCPTSVGAGDCDDVWDDVQRAFAMWGFFTEELDITFAPTAGGNADLEVFFGQNLGIPIGEMVGLDETYAQVGYDLEIQRPVIVLDDDVTWWPSADADGDPDHLNVERAVGHQIGHHLGLDHGFGNDVMAGGTSSEPIPLSCGDLSVLASEYGSAGFGTGCAVALQAASQTSGLYAMPGEAVTPAPTVKAVDASGNPVGGVTVLFDARDGSGFGVGAITRGALATDATGLTSVTDWGHAGAIGTTFDMGARIPILGTEVFSATVGAPVGDIQVETSTTGEAPDPDGYTVTVGEDARTIAVDGQVTFEGLAPGTYDVALSGLAANCSVVGDNPAQATVVELGTAEVEFEVTCPSNIGDIQVTTVTAGPVPDPDGYTVTVGEDARAIGLDDMVTFEDLAPGNYTVTLSGIESNCSVVGENPVEATVTQAATTEVGFAVDCPESPEPGGLLAHWPLDGDASDATGNGFDGTVIGPTAIMDRFGNEASAFEFDGVDDFVDIGQPVVPSTATSFSISAWIKSNGQQQPYAVPVSQGTRSFQGFAFTYGLPHYTANSFLAGAEGDWKEADFGLDYEAQYGWHHYVVTYGGGMVNTYLDGALEDSQPMNIDVGAYDFNIGRDTENKYPSHRVFNGLIDDVRVFEGTLIQEEIDYLYSGEGNLLHVEMKSKGESLDPDGYFVTVQGVGSKTIGTNTSMVFTDVPTGINYVLVEDVAPNCDIPGIIPRDVTVPEGGTARITISVNCTPVHEPEGEVFYSKGGDIYKLDLATMVETDLLATAADEANPIVSPDGTQIAFASDANAALHQLWIMDVDGTNATEYASGFDVVRPTDWLGTQILLSVNHPSAAETEVVWVDTGIPTTFNAIYNLANHDTEPARGWLSPTTVGSARTAQAPTAGGAVLLIPVGGGAPVTAWSDAAAHGTRGFSVSHSGDWAVFEYATSSGGTPSLYLMDMTSGTYDVTLLKTNGSMGVWAPDDDLILFHRDGDLWVTDLDGVAQPLLADGTVRAARSWIPLPPPG